MEYIKEFFKKDIVKRLMVLLMIILFFYLLRSVLNLILLTFLFTYLVYSVQKILIRIFGRFVKIKLNQTFATIIIYTILFVLLAFFIYRFIPIIVNQFINIIYNISHFNLYTFTGGMLNKYAVKAIESVDIKSYSDKGASYLLEVLRGIGTWSVNVFLALMLSLVFMLEKVKIKQFMHRFRSSRISGIYDYIRYYWKNFLNSFGKVIQAQILIAIVNAIISTISLWIMGFPQILGLGVMIFILSLIPVAGAIISLVPLSIIAYNIGGFMEIIYVIILIAALHALESYVLNPKLMSAKMQLPVFFIFIILIVSEHFMGVWGLLLGVPLFMFILDLLGLKDTSQENIPKEEKK